jgi:SNF2 family DNA or RNA helicase
VYLPAVVFKKRSSEVLTWFLGAWFGLLPLSLPELGGPLIKASKNNSSYSSTEAIWCNQAEENIRKLSMESSTGSDLIGGTSTSDTSPARILKQYFRETLGEKIFEHVDEGAEYRDSLLNVLVYVLGVEGASFARKHLEDSCRELIDRTASLNGVLDHLQNLGHDAISSVEGLNVNLFDFQRESIKWAIEHENMPDGIQSLFWIKMSTAEQGKEIYYSPILRRFRDDKPVVVRGGVLADGKGLGKTVTSLALILQNPAPLFPPSGGSIEALQDATRTRASSSKTRRWDIDLYSRTSALNPKRGSIISRGTLVVCHASLVGQWMDEAKSKLNHPGQLYMYHGKNRKRDPLKLAENAIVFTTYGIITSDAKHHGHRSDDPNYCAPLEQIRWWRIICDESQFISPTLRGLVSDHKWLVTGKYSSQARTISLGRLFAQHFS